MMAEGQFCFTAKWALETFWGTWKTESEIVVSCQETSVLLNAWFLPWFRREDLLFFSLLWFRHPKLWGKRLIQLKVSDAPNSNLHENWEYSFHGLILYHLSSLHIFFLKKLLLIKIRAENVSPGVASIGRNESGRSREITWDLLSLIDWLGQSIRLGLVHVLLDNLNNWVSLPHCDMNTMLFTTLLSMQIAE